MKKSLICFLLILILLSGCSRVGSFLPDGSDISPPPVETTAPVTTQNVEPNVPAVEIAEYKAKLEAESGVISGDLKVSQTKKGYSGAGYLTGFTAKPENKLKISVNIPTSQHYNISLVVSSDSKRNNVLTINDNDVSEFITSGGAGFEIIIIKNVFMDKGVNTLGIREISGGIDLDNIQIANSTDVTNISVTPQSTLINPNANQRTKNTMTYLAENFGKNIISGQYSTIGTNKELELIYKTTGRYPALRLGDLSSFKEDSAKETSEINQSIKWAEKGGLVGYVWHWEAPMNEPSYYKEKTTFDITKAVTTENIALLPYNEIEQLYKDNKISPECLAIIKDIDTVSAQLSKLQDNNVTVLWRPLHEAGGGWFWWGANKDAYLWLWNLLYERQTNYHKLNNLIWVWNAQDAGWYVGDNKCDIVSADIYSNTAKLNSQLNTYLQLSKMSANKLISLSECSNPPSIDFMLRDKATWSWFGVWSGDYIMDTNGELSEKNITKDQLINIYSHKNLITIDKLPDLRGEKSN